MPRSKDDNDKSSHNFKARLEKKLNLAEQSASPVFDVTDCNLKKVPSKVFTLCKAFRKEALHLQHNSLSDLGSKSLADLRNLRELDVSVNNLSKIPNNINELEQLQVFNLSRNNLVSLPETIGDLLNLRVLDVSYNDIKSLPSSIGNCKNMEVLNLIWNENLKELPPTLAKLKSLVQLHVDTTVTYPPKVVCRQGIVAILNFLSKDLQQDTNIPSTSKVDNTVAIHDDLQEKIQLLEKRREEKQNEHLRLERELKEQNQREIEIQQRLKDEKKKFIQDVKNQQDALDADIIKLTKKTSEERALRLKHILEGEKRSNEVVGKILSLKKDLRLQYTKEWEKERKVEEELLWSSAARTKNLERKKILVSMEEHMKDEIFSSAQKVSSDRRLKAIKSLGIENMSLTRRLSELMKTRNEKRSQLVDSLARDQELQKAAVFAMLKKTDAASWELSREIAIVEEQLAELTRMEVLKKKLESEAQITELNNNRIALTAVLKNLLERQTLRRNQLIEAIRKMELMKESIKDSELFWLQQYDKLLNSRAHEMVQYLEGINSKLVYEMYINGVFHYLPLLKECTLDVEKIGEINESVLAGLGISSHEDRSKILCAIQEFITCNAKADFSPSSPVTAQPSSLTLHLRKMSRNHNFTYIEPDECVICMELQPSVVFVPCGHICCCSKCYKSITECPLCRKRIEEAHERV